MKKYTKVLCLLLALLGIALMTAMAAIQKEAVVRQEDATPIKEGVMSEKQKEHSKIYKDYGTGKKIKDIVAEAGDVKLKRHIGSLGGDPNQTTPTLGRFLQDMTCHADAIIVGIVKSKSSQLTERGDFIFTDYGITVREVLKNNNAAYIQPNTDIIFTGPGGKIQINGRIVEAVDDSFEPLKLDENYLLFLKFIPTTGAYKALNSASDFNLSDDKVRKATREPLGVDKALEREDTGSLLRELRAITSQSNCAGGANE